MLDRDRDPQGRCLLREQFPSYQYIYLTLETHMLSIATNSELWLDLVGLASLVPILQVLRGVHYNHAGVSPDGKQVVAFSLLKLALQTRNAELLKCIIVSGYDVEESLLRIRYEKPGYTPLHRYSESDDPSLELVRTLLQLGASPNQHELFGRSALYYAALRPKAPLLMALLLGFHKTDVHERYERHMTLTHVAISARNFEALSVILKDKRTDLDLLDSDGRTPLAFAAYWNDFHLFESIVKRSRTFAHETEDMSPIIFMARHGKREVTLTMINKFSDTNSHLSDDRRSIVHWSVIQA